MVKQALYEGLYRPLDNSDPDLSLINAINAWTAVGGPGNAGAGVKVGIIDTGIDQTHDCFNPAGYAYPAGFPKGDHSFTTPKVIVAKVFNNQSNRFGYTARAVQEHGTHVAAPWRAISTRTRQLPAFRFRTASRASRPGRISGTTTSFREPTTTPARRTFSTRSTLLTRTGWTSST